MENDLVVIRADFNNIDEDGFLRLNNEGTIGDLKARGISLREGLKFKATDGDITADVVVRPPGKERIWRAEIVGEMFDAS